MSRKNICILAGAVFSIAIYWLGFVNGVYYAENKTETVVEDTEVSLSDDEMFDRYIEERYGSGHYGVVDFERDGYVYYDVYSEDGELVSILSSVRKSKIYG